NVQIAPLGIVNTMGRLCALPQALNFANALESSATPLHAAPKSVTMFFAIMVGAGGTDGPPEPAPSMSRVCRLMTSLAPALIVIPLTLLVASTPLAASAPMLIALLIVTEP